MGISSEESGNSSWPIFHAFVQIKKTCLGKEQLWLGKLFWELRWVLWSPCLTLKGKVSVIATVWSLGDGKQDGCQGSSLLENSSFRFHSNRNNITVCDFWHLERWKVFGGVITESTPRNMLKRPSQKLGADNNEDICHVKPSHKNKKKWWQRSWQLVLAEFTNRTGDVYEILLCPILTWFGDYLLFYLSILFIYFHSPEWNSWHQALFFFSFWIFFWECIQY